MHTHAKPSLLYGTGLYSVSITGGACVTSTSATHCGGDTQDLQIPGEFQPQWSSARERITDSHYTLSSHARLSVMSKSKVPS